MLKRNGLTEEDLKQHVSKQIDLMRLVDARLRPNVSIDSKSIESYYNQQLLPQLRQSGAKEIPLAEVTPKIKELLTQQQMDQLLVAWLQNLRSGSEIRRERPIPRASCNDRCRRQAGSPQVGKASADSGAGGFAGNRRPRLVRNHGFFSSHGAPPRGGGVAANHRRPRRTLAASIPFPSASWSMFVT